MGARAYKKDSHVRKLVEQGGFEKKAAETNVEVDYEVVEEVTENLASKEFVESEFKVQREYIDKELAEMKSDMAEMKSDMAEMKSDMAEMKSDMAGMKSDMTEMKSELKEQNSKITGMKVEIAKLGTRFMFIAVGIVALMQGLAWLSQQGG